MAERFAPGVVGEDLHTSVVFSPDGQEAYWRLMDEDEANEIVFTRLEEEGWTAPQVVPFASRFFDSDDPCFSPDGKKLFFTSWRPLAWYRLFDLQQEGIWYVEKTERGWSRPRPVAPAINEMDLHWQMSVSARGTLCFASEKDIFCSRFEDGQYQIPERLSSAINTAGDEGHPFIAPDESYLIFSAYSRPGGMGDYDLHITFRDADGSWSEAMNLGPGVNTQYQELYPAVSPDGKYLFFLSNRDRAHGVYWVDFETVKQQIFE
jgi:Tol biopolymer transport system component